ncbi:ankyrin repeat and SOCS box protein 8-like [Mercenaria mercenaria]|uniref:ankyrin repeat and SOCS box protein 8-like n=1 Tax=Mercenaria mercenaria TaxID=6596 RepID=UPI00234EF847|nr:ankyrin repeat and SOCS box protein 8-like [Mercenaria mercenaria]
MELLDPNVSPEYALQCIKWCAENGETCALEEHLRSHKDNLKDELVPVLCNAFTKGHDRVIKIMLSALDQEIRATYSKDEKSLFQKLLCRAVETGDSDIVKDLINKGANVNGYFYGKPILHVAACYGYSDVVVELVKAGGDINSVDKRGDGIIHSILTSQLNKKDAMVRRIITLGANPLAKSSSGKLPIHLAAKNAPGVLAEIVKDGHDVSILDDVNNETPLHVACGAVCRETILILIQSGCRFNIESKDGQTPLAKLLRFTNNVHDFHTKTRLQLAHELISIGFRMNQRIKVPSTTYNKGRDKCYDRYVSLRKSLKALPSLQSLARLTIRESLTLKTGYQKEINKLDIPVNLKSFIMFHDLKL